MFPLNSYWCRQLQTASPAIPYKDCEEAQDGEVTQGYQDDGARSMMSDPTNEKILHSKPTDKDIFLRLCFENKEQQTKELEQSRHCSSCVETENTTHNSRDDLTAIMEKLEENHKSITERTVLLFTDYNALSDELKKCHETVNEDNVMKTEFLKLNTKIADLEKQYFSEAGETRRTIKKLKETVNKISSENEELFVAMTETFEQRHNEMDRNEFLKLNAKICDLEKQYFSEAEETRETIKELKETVNKISSENEELFVAMTDTFEQRHNEMDRNEFLKLNAKIADLERQYFSEAKETRKTIKELKETVNKISSENEKLYVRMTEMFEQRHNDMERYEKAMELLNEAVEKILSENKKQKQEICDDASDDTTVSTHDEEVEHLNKKGSRKIKYKHNQIEFNKHAYKGIAKNILQYQAMKTTLTDENAICRSICDRCKGFTRPAEPSGTHLPTLDDFNLLNVLGSGGFGMVHLVRKNGGEDNRKLYAMKLIGLNEKTSEHTLFEQCRVECYIHERAANTPFLVPLYYAFHTQSHLLLVVEYYPGGDMSNLLSEKKRFTENEARLYMAEIVLAVEYLHHQINVIHRDLKPENILIDSQGHIAITDYGLSRHIPRHVKDKHASSECGTGQYMAPEVVYSKGYSFEVDWWSTGVILYEMIAGHQPFERHRIISSRRDFPTDFSSEAANLVIRLLKKNPKKRLGFGKNNSVAIKKHNFFHGIKWKDVERRAIKMPYQPYDDITSSVASDSTDSNHTVVGTDQEDVLKKATSVSNQQNCETSHSTSSVDNAEVCLYVAPQLRPEGKCETQTSQKHPSSNRCQNEQWGSIRGLTCICTEEFGNRTEKKKKYCGKRWWDQLRKKY
ncbi:beta-adrenergic receptor kinase 2-like isoform X1 [Zootermopsis nevadensis]|uniref:beta-adrenergic receptor kinase 2-like isoform X1 n=2 Tax=Zootermopsis nevadensis TaxID=136037 RepID=UPI000B8EBC7E|nr:beta-adrenergic receptor kinase 2-like isoform X1 [Zootermopsis nevadensis]